MLQLFSFNDFFDAVTGQDCAGAVAFKLNFHFFNALTAWALSVSSFL